MFGVGVGLSGVTNKQSSLNNADDAKPVRPTAARAQEREAAKYMALGSQKVTLGVAVALYLIFLVVPYAGSVSGWEIIAGRAGDYGVKISLMEYVAIWLNTIGVGVLTTLTLVTCRATTGLVAWMMSTVSFAICIFGFWARGTDVNGPKIGMYLGVLAAALAAVAYSLVALRRSPEQLEAAQHARAEAGKLDRVGVVQRDIMHTPSEAENPLLIDDRRAQAARRHRKNIGERTGDEQQRD